MSRIHRYEGEHLIVEFELGRCIHTGDCTRALPAVFDTRRTGRWVHPDGASPEAVAKVCADCPTGALRCVARDTGTPLHEAPQENTIRIVADGPLYVHAAMQVNGEPEPTHRTALCRCGASKLMPRCDNSHKTCGFRDAGKVADPEAGQAGEAGGLILEAGDGGPLHVAGPFTLLDANGDAVCRNNDAWLCRCGGSANKPYCDGTHKKNGFKG